MITYNEAKEVIASGKKVMVKDPESRETFIAKFVGQGKHSLYAENGEVHSRYHLFIVGVYK